MQQAMPIQIRTFDSSGERFMVKQPFCETRCCDSALQNTSG